MSDSRNVLSLKFPKQTFSTFHQFTFFFLPDITQKHGECELSEYYRIVLNMLTAFLYSYLFLCALQYFVQLSMERIFLELILPKPHGISSSQHCNVLQQIQVWCPNNYKQMSFAIPTEWKKVIWKNVSK